MSRRAHWQKSSIITRPSCGERESEFFLCVLIFFFFFVSLYSPPDRAMVSCTCYTARFLQRTVLKKKFYARVSINIIACVRYLVGFIFFLSARNNCLTIRGQSITIKSQVSKKSCFVRIFNANTPPCAVDKKKINKYVIKTRDNHTGKIYHFLFIVIID